MTVPNRGRLLVVDDCEIWRTLMRCSFSVDTWDVVEAETAEDAWSLYRSEPFDALVVDVLLPGVSGFDLVREIRNQPGGASLPVVLVSGRHSREFIEQALHAGADLFVRKHHDTRSLVICVQRLASRAENPSPLKPDEDGRVHFTTLQ